MRAARFTKASTRPSGLVLLVLLSLVTALAVHTDVATAAPAAQPAAVHTASPGCGDEDDGPSGHGDASAVRPARVEPGRPGSARLPRALISESVPLPEPRAAIAVPATRGTDVLITLGVSRT
ncbi:hypothetical protein [Actinomadura rupiterrae]|uniref:hypothetical protein n=1 Tax=Actinomadura rupiterrae TaxID=559627 RepID=UPI0020A2CDF1|nr:hypothetical protein [Actinomadura rupiterrae]MCP2341435.1 hypothetical protein [Actinomadura rupiterrae]